jgi:hypothetical protein
VRVFVSGCAVAPQTGVLARRWTTAAAPPTRSASHESAHASSSNLEIE